MDRRRRVALRIAAGAAALLLAWWLLRPGPGGPDPGPEPAAAITAAVIPPPPPPPAPPPSPPPPPDPEPIPGPPPPPPAPPPPVEEFLDWRIRGSVHSSDGLPVEGAAVAVVFEHPEVGGADLLPLREERLAPLREFLRPGVSDAAGAFEVGLRLTRIASVRVRAAARGFLPGELWINLVEGREQGDLRFVLERAVGIEGRVLDQEGAPVAGAWVGLVSRREKPRVDGARTGPDGRYRIAEAPEGECLLRAIPPKEAPRGSWVRRSPLRLALGGDRDVDFVLEWAEAGGATVRVELLDPAGGPRPFAAKTSLQPLDGWYEEKVLHVPRAPKCGAGSVTLEGVPPGAWRLWIETYGKKARFVDFTVVPEEREVDARLLMGGTGEIRGRLDRAGIPADPKRQSMVLFELVGNGSFPQFALWDEETMTGKEDLVSGGVPLAADGSFRIRNLLPGNYHVTFQDGRISAAGDVAVAEGKTARLDLVGRPIGTLVVKGTVPADCGWRRLSVWEEGGIRKPGMQGQVAPGTAFEVKREVHPGPVHWHVTWSLLEPAAGGYPPDAVVEGVVEVGPGETVVVEVPAPEK